MFLISKKVGSLIFFNNPKKKKKKKKKLGTSRLATRRLNQKQRKQHRKLTCKR